MKKIIVFGVGDRLYHLIESEYLKGFEVMAFCDNDVSKQGKMLSGVEVISPANIEKYEFDAIYISSDKYYEEIRRELETKWKIDRDRIGFIQMKKHDGEMSYWKDKFGAEGGKF